MKIERPLALKVYSVLCSTFIISQFLHFVNMIHEIYEITFREVEKVSLCKGSLFMFIYDLSIFLTSTAYVDTNAKYGIPLWRYAVF